MRLANEIVASSETVLFGIVGEVVHEIPSREIFRKGLHFGEFLQCLPVIVGVLEGVLQYETADCRLLIIGSNRRCVFWHEYVGSDSTAAIDNPSVVGVVCRSRVLDTVLREELSVLIAAEQVLLVVGIVTRLEWLLYASSRRGVVACDGESDHASVGELYLLLYESFAEGAPSDDDTSVVVLDSSGKDFGC